jgi:hypothetical protein
MATTILLNLIASLVVVVGLAAVCRLAYVGADERVGLPAWKPESAPAEELDRAA